jgi:hypothetical protein
VAVAEELKNDGSILSIVVKRARTHSQIQNHQGYAVDVSLFASTYSWTLRIPNCRHILCGVSMVIILGAREIRT